MRPVPVSVVVPVRNEEGAIGDFIAAHAWAAQCLVVDNGSEDATAALATAAGATVISAPGLTIGAARNVGIAAASQEWVLSLDADERADPEFADELARVIDNPGCQAYRIHRRNRYLGREQKRGSWGNDRVLRLARRSARFTEDPVHEKLIAPLPHGDLTAAVWHEPYRDLSHHIAKMDQYARWGAGQLHERGRRAGVFDLVARPVWRFLKAYLLRGQFLDGRFGLVTAILGAQTAFLKYAHLWALERERSGQREG